MGKVDPNLSRTKNRQDLLPASLPPIMVCREIAAAAVTASPTLFDDMVAKGLMPKAKRLSDGRIAWLVSALTRAAEALPDVDGNDEADTGDDDNEWNTLCGSSSKTGQAQ